MEERRRGKRSIRPSLRPSWSTSAATRRTTVRLRTGSLHARATVALRLSKLLTPGCNSRRAFPLRSGGPRPRFPKPSACVQLAAERPSETCTPRGLGCQMCEPARNAPAGGPGVRSTKPDGDCSTQSRGAAGMTATVAIQPHKLDPKGQVGATPSPQPQHALDVGWFHTPSRMGFESPRCDRLVAL